MDSPRSTIKTTISHTPYAVYGLSSASQTLPAIANPVFPFLSHPPHQLGGVKVSRPKAFNQVSALTSSQETVQVQPHDAMSELFWQVLVDQFPEGVLVLSRDLQLVYSSFKAEGFCQKLAMTAAETEALPAVIVEACQQLLTQTEPLAAVVAECQTPDRLQIRLRVRWLQSQRGQEAIADRQFILVLLENRNEVLAEELQIERQKYDLTEREAEVWSYLRQGYSYRDIANTLKISLNTVKTHIKNVYAKIRNLQEQSNLRIL